MRRSAPTRGLLSLCLLFACADTPTDKAGDTDDTGDEALPETSGAGAGAVASGQLDDVNAPDVMMMTITTLGLSAEIKDQALGRAADRPSVGACEPDVTVVDAEAEEVDIDFTPCEDQGLAGPLGCRDAQALTAREGYSINGLSLTGDVVLEAEDTVIHFATAEGAPLVVTDGTTTLTTSFDLYGDRDRTAHATTFWGAGAVVRSTDAESQGADVFLGGLDAESVTGAPLEFQTGDLCFCPTSGVVGLGTTYTVREVSVDPDLYVSPGDGEDDYPEVTIPLAAPVTSTLLIGTTFGETCGDLTLEVSAAEATATVTWEQLGRAVCEQTCDGSWGEDDRCAVETGDEACSRGANAIGRVADSGAPDLSVTLDASALTERVSGLVQEKITGDRCSPGWVAGLADGRDG